MGLTEEARLYRVRIELKSPITFGESGNRSWLLIFEIADERLAYIKPKHDKDDKIDILVISDTNGEEHNIPLDNIVLWAIMPVDMIPEVKMASCSFK